jgi:hypothetical protein
MSDCPELSEIYLKFSKRRKSNLPRLFNARVIPHLGIRKALGVTKDRKKIFLISYFSFFREHIYITHAYIIQ